MFEPDIIGLGIANVDLVLQIKDMPTWKKPGMVSGFTLADGGPAGTACAVAAMLDAKTGFIDTFGNDEIAAIKLRSLEQAGVDISHMVKREAPEDHVIIVYVQEKTGERCFSVFQGILSQPLQLAELDRDYITSARYLHLDCCHPGRPRCRRHTGCTRRKRRWSSMHRQPTSLFPTRYGHW